MADEKQDKKTKWRFGFRWCESCFCKCQSQHCMDNDVCAQVIGGVEPDPQKVIAAFALNTTLRQQ